MRYAQSTTVTIERSRAEIESILGRYGTSKFAYFSEEHRAMIAFEIKGKRIRFIIPLPDKSETRFNRKKHYNSSRQMTPEESQKVWEQACRQKWRALSLIIKAKLEYVESGDVTVEEEFLSNIVLPNNRTVSEMLIPQLTQLYESGKIPLLIPEVTT